MKFPGHVYPNGNMLTVVGHLEDTQQPEVDKGYIYGDKIYQYKDKKCSRGKFPTVYPEETNPVQRLIEYHAGGIKYVTQPDIYDKLIGIGELRENSFELIVSKTDPDAKYTEEKSTNINIASGAVYEPEIESGDDFLKRIIKTVFRLKKTHAQRYRKMLAHSYSFPNLLQGLNGKTKVSVTAWQTWIELLGLDCYIIVKDNGDDKGAPISDMIIYDSKHDKVNTTDKDGIIEILKKEL